jgi:hypothetical protein
VCIINFFLNSTAAAARSTKTIKAAAAPLPWQQKKIVEDNKKCGVKEFNGP